MVFFDHSCGCPVHTPEDRAEYRVNIYRGKVVKEGNVFSTTKMPSHDKKGFAAYTLNTNGELSTFTHNRMCDQVAHSTMNAGVPVVAAGEIQIENGVLKKISTHSGHYRPTLFNVYRLLEHLSNRGMYISQAKIVTFDNPSQTLPNVQSERVYYDAYEDNMC